MERPELLTIDSAETFEQWYWLKAELVEYCRAHGLKVSGNRADLAARIKTFLLTGKKENTAQPTNGNNKRPKSSPKSKFDWHSAPLSLNTKITNSYKNTQNVRRFMISQVGKGFRFSIPLMAWIKENEGKTLQAVVEKWHQLQVEKKQPGYQTTIPPGNQYNQYVRDFMADNPGAALTLARRCWAYKRSIPGSNGYHPDDLIGAGVTHN